METKNSMETKNKYEVQTKKFHQQLISEEKSPATIEKYVRDASTFCRFLGNRELAKELVMDYKHSLLTAGYALGSINSMLVSVNTFLTFIGKADCRVKSLREQRQIYQTEDKNLSKTEYYRLLKAAGKDIRLNLLLQTICSTGIRVSELQYFTVEAIVRGDVTVTCKNKQRNVIVPSMLRRKLLQYVKNMGITNGVIFRTRSGKPLDRSNIWSMMKKLCQSANVKASKVFPHNLRKLFARTFHGIEKDIAKLADILGHSSINTTRIYIMSTGAEHRQRIEQLRLVL